jgi:hypothetical protein
LKNSYFFILTPSFLLITLYSLLIPSSFSLLTFSWIMGAPKGNANALKHGLYARHISPADRAGLRNMPPGDYQDEIYMMRVVIKNLFELHHELYQSLQSLDASERYAEIEALAKITNSLSLAITALNTTARTHALLTGTDASVNDAFEQALNSLPVILDAAHLIEARSDGDEPPEVLVE